MTTESPAEKMHNRILNGTSYSTRNVTADDFESVAHRVGTLELPEVKEALEKLRDTEKLTRGVF